MTSQMNSEQFNDRSSLPILWRLAKTTRLGDIEGRSFTPRSLQVYEELA